MSVYAARDETANNRRLMAKHGIPNRSQYPTNCDVIRNNNQYWVLIRLSINFTSCSKLDLLNGLPVGGDSIK